MSSTVIMHKCSCCPRFCSVDRTQDKGFCSSTFDISLSTVSLHFGEEPILSGTHGSAAFFFAGCTLRCAFCQNWQISRSKMGQNISVEKLKTLFLLAQNKGAHNINLVSGTQYYTAIIEAIHLAREEGLSLPLMWNCGGYDRIEVIQALKDAGIAIFLPDLKFMDKKLAGHYTMAGNYPEVATLAIQHMLQDLPLQWDNQGLLTQGVIIRHLIIPGHIEDSIKVLQWFAHNAKGKALLSLMTQYTPVVIPDEHRTIPQRFLSIEEHDQILHEINNLGIEEGFFQDLVWQDDWLPDFSSNSNPFQDSLAQTLWHYKDKTQP